MNVYIKSGDITDMQGPGPTGYHVPTKDEWQAIYDAGISLGAWISSGGTNLSTYLKLPIAGRRFGSDIGLINRGKYGYYWSSTPNGADYVYILNFYSSNIFPQTYANRSIGLPVRCFKDSPIIPTSSWTTLYQGSGSAGIFHNSTDGLISISSDGTTWYTIMDKNLGATNVYNYGDTLTEANCGKVYQWGNNYAFSGDENYDVSQISESSTQVDVTGYGPGNYYNSSTWITTNPRQNSSNNGNNLRGGETGPVSMSEVKNIYIGEYKLINTAGIYHNADLGLISLSSDGTNRTTIADKNLGATQVYENQSDARTLANCGNYYQWGNNYGFGYGIAFPNTSYTQVDATGYGPGNYYNSDTYVSSSSGWLTGYFPNLWGNSTNTNDARQGPCDTGWHVPSKTEMENWVSLWETITGNGSSAGAAFLQHFFIPLMGYRTVQGYYQLGSVSKFWNTHGINKQAYYLYVSNSNIITTGSENNAYAEPIRPFKNEAVQPTSSWDVIYQPS